MYLVLDMALSERKAPTKTAFVKHKALSSIAIIIIAADCNDHIVIKVLNTLVSPDVLRDEY